jgi:hypothetical protein
VEIVTAHEQAIDEYENGISHVSAIRHRSIGSFMRAHGKVGRRVWPTISVR